MTSHYIEGISNKYDRASSTLTNMSACHLHLLITVDVWEKSKTESVTARWVSEAVDCQRRQWRVERLADTTVQFIVRDAAPVWGLHIHHRLHSCRNRRRQCCRTQHTSYTTSN